jgi:hypothetical protein
VLDEFLLYLQTAKASTKSGFGRAVHYTVHQWKSLERYLLDGRLEISNGVGYNYFSTEDIVGIAVNIDENKVDFYIKTENYQALGQQPILKAGTEFTSLPRAVQLTRDQQ